MFASEDDVHAGLTRGAQLWWRDHLAHPGFLALEAKHDREVLDGVAADLGLSRDELAEISRRGPRAADELGCAFGGISIEV